MMATSSPMKGEGKKELLLLPSAGKRRGALSFIALALLALLAIWAVRGCAYLPWNREPVRGVARITVSRDFGKVVLRDQRVEAAGISALEALKKVAKVETAYGGGFIVSIDGLASTYRGEGSRKLDWFFYVNGQMAETGAAEYTVREGDRIVFDYHSWELSPFTPFLAGCFPQPFLGGYPAEPQRCRVLHGEGLGVEAEGLAVSLREAGVKEVVTGPLLLGGDPLLGDFPGEYLVLLAEAGELETLEGWRRAMAEARSRGLFFHLEGGKLTLLDERGNRAGELLGEWGLVAGLTPRMGETGSALVITGRGKGLWEAWEALRKRLDNEDPRPLLAMAYLEGEGEFPLPWEGEAARWGLPSAHGGTAPKQEVNTERERWSE